MNDVLILVAISVVVGVAAVGLLIFLIGRRDR